MGTKRKTARPAKKKASKKPAEPVVISSTFAPEHPESSLQKLEKENVSWLHENARPLLLLALCVLVAVTVSLWLLRSHTTPVETTKTTGRLTPAQVDARATADQIASLQQRIKLTKDPTEKYDDEAQLSAIYFSQGTYTDAFKLANDVERHTHTAASAGALGDIYMAQKDYKNAVKFYTLARDRSQPPTSPQERSPYNDYNYQLQQAEQAAK